MAHILRIVMLLWLCAGVALAQDEIGVSAAWQPANSGRAVAVSFDVPSGYTVYAERISVTSVGAVTLRPLDIPAPKEKLDPITEEMEKVYDHDFTFTYAVEPTDGKALDLQVGFQACDKSVCFLPTRRTLTVAGEAPASEPTQSPEAALPVPAPLPLTAQSPKTGSWQESITQFRIGATTSGFVPVQDFLPFLERGARGEGTQNSAIRDAFEQRGIWAACLLILVGGLLLNLTPCVLPMIPVNIAIIGAGTSGGSRWRGLLLGSAYGLGIALVYGILGLVVVLTGASFGTLNASPWFNLAIAVIFILLALAMFDVIPIDFSRFQSRLGSSQREGSASVLTAMLFGGVAALLAGACVAPVVIAVVLMATDLYQRGHQAGLLLPFLLGAGMALPWPLAGAGLAVLPRPGRWMERIKIAFGIIILLVALWYGRLGIALLRDRAAAQHATAEQTSHTPGEGGWLTSLEEGLATGQREGRPVFIDFWATWCKNCLHMDATTFRDPAVEARLADFVKVKFRAEDPSDPQTKAVLDHFGARGLPFYVVLLPHDANP